MDIAVIVKFLAPCLPFLLTMGNKAAEGASQKVGEDVWNSAKVIWAKLWPKVEAKEAAKEAAEDVAKNPDDEDLQVSLRVQLKKILEADTALAEEIAKILEEQKSDGGSSVVNAQSYDESTQIITGRDVVSPTYDMRRINNPK
ncbi:MAG: hypothetical protein AN483_15330 [Aphanizomenon flos-aquae MDT14a]|jgi:DNA helicase IV|nr:hypothetical protein [Aphanizomenon flos-aquae CP01]OBQ28503.1 MAG: hypothetical protein AN483_15330 [Aphanizomenon flos-aquae MDT14a]